MTALSLIPFTDKAPHWLVGVALGGVAWNLYGAVEFAGTLSATAESLVASGLSPEQAAVMAGHPAWMTAAFGIGVGGGIVGSALMLLRHRAAALVLAASLAAYVALWIGDWAHGVFAVMGAPQVIILTLVVAIATALFAASRHPAARR